MLDLLRILASFAVIFILLKRKVKLGPAMLAAALFLGLLYGFHLVFAVKVIAKSAVLPSTLTLAGTMVLIMLFEALLRRTGITPGMVGGLEHLFRDSRLIMGFLPAFLGFLPSAGGAMFSAPLVGEVAEHLDIPPEQKGFINYWYRHVWEYVFPLFPAVILASRIIGVPLRDILLHQVPFSLVAIIVGVPFAFRGISGKLEPNGPVNSRAGALKPVLKGIIPILAIILMVLIFNFSVLLSLTVVFAAVAFFTRYRRIIELIKDNFPFEIVLLVFGVMAFREMIMETGAVDALPAYFQSLGVPVIMVVMGLPFLVGMLTGMSSAMVATTFPILSGLFRTGGTVDLYLLALAYVSGFAGCMVSPVHLCLIVSVDYFKASFFKVYRMVLLPEAIVVALALVLYLV